MKNDALYSHFADKNGLVSGRLACTSSKNLKQKSILDFNLEFSIQSRMPWKVKEIILDNILMQPQSNVPDFLN